jgi:FG-GAP-like repeat
MSNDRPEYRGGTLLCRILFGLIPSLAVAWPATSQADGAGASVGAAVAGQAAIVAAESDTSSVKAKRIAWAGRGAYRVLIEVAPIDLGDRKQDELPAQVNIDWPSLLESLDVRGKADLRSLQVIRFNPETGRPILHTDYAYQRGPYDRAFRWYDASIPYDFPEVLAPTSRTDGVRKRVTHQRTGYMYNAVGDWESGRLSWTHTQEGDAPSTYAVYFDVMDRATPPPDAPPRGWIGDAMPRHDRWGKTTTGAGHTQIALDDWNGDGLFDIVYGEQYGQVLVLINTGTPGNPAFGPGRMLFDSQGMPLDSGMHASPLVIDWDGDGAKDLLIGTYQNRIAFYRNAGTNLDRVLEYRGFLRDATGQFLALPVTPVAAKSEGVFKEDYYPVLSAVDWDGDGDTDLLCGGYITGRVYFYRNTGRRDGLPLLELAGPVEADGEPINVRDWCASPCAADFNGDGLLDLVVGSYTWHPDTTERPSFLRYYVNQGTRSAPDLRERPFPVRGDAIRMRLPKPRAIDFNGDGLIDLAVSSGENITLYPNVGTASEPLFDLDRKPIRAAWGNAAAPSTHQVLDWNNDGWPDLVSGYVVHLNAGIGKPYFWDKTVNVLPDGVYIDHPTDIGDGHFYPYLWDLDQDGRMDVLFGDWHGNVWFHRNLSTDEGPAFDEQGRRLRTPVGPIKVGPLAGDIEGDFQALQGARTTLVPGDFDGDGLDDLIVGDTYGIIRYFRNMGPVDAPQFSEPVVIAELKTRLHVDSADWDGDGRLDVVASLSSHKIYVVRNAGTQGEAPFLEPELLDVFSIKGPIATVVDLNRDGDEDLLISGTQGTSFVERSFLDHGYGRGRVLKIESLPARTQR